MAKAIQIFGFGTPFASLAKDGKIATGSEAANILFNPTKFGGGMDMFGALSSSGAKQESTPSAPLPMPQAPDASAVADKAQQNATALQRKRATTSQSVYTSPLGVSGQASVARKTLTGQ